MLCVSGSSAAAAAAAAVGGSGEEEPDDQEEESAEHMEANAGENPDQDVAAVAHRTVRSMPWQENLCLAGPNCLDGSNVLDDVPWLADVHVPGDTRDDDVDPSDTTVLVVTWMPPKSGAGRKRSRIYSLPSVTEHTVARFAEHHASAAVLTTGDGYLKVMAALGPVLSGKSAAAILFGQPSGLSMQGSKASQEGSLGPSDETLVALLYLNSQRNYKLPIDFPGIYSSLDKHLIGSLASGPLSFEAPVLHCDCKDHRDGACINFVDFIVRSMTGTLSADGLPTQRNDLWQITCLAPLHTSPAVKVIPLSSYRTHEC